MSLPKPNDIEVFITSSLIHTQKRVSPNCLFSAFKKKLVFITGIPENYQIINYCTNIESDIVLKLSDPNDPTLVENESKLLLDLKIVPFSHFKVQNSHPDSAYKALENDDGQNVEFVLSEKAYSRKKNNMREWMNKNVYSKNQNESEIFNKKKELDNNLSVGKRCLVLSKKIKRPGVIKFIGEIDFLEKPNVIWVGVEFDEKLGQNDGSLNGKRFFHCEQGYGSIVKAENVEIDYNHVFELKSETNVCDDSDDEI